MSAPAIVPPDGVVADLDKPTDIIRTVNFITQGLTLAFCSFFVFVRAFQKFRSPAWHLAIDDYLTATLWILMVGYCICGIFLSLHGGGYHIWEISSAETTRYLQTAYAATLFYAPMILFIKLSLLSLIVRVFSPYKKRIQGIYAIGAILVVYYTTSLVLKIRICWPISAYWKLQTDKCLDQSAILVADSIISTVTDAIILVLPLPLTWSLQLQGSKKLRVIGMLAVGGLATAFSAWRLHLILTNGESADATILFVQVVLSGNAEAGIALICTCLPASVAQFRLMRTRARYGSSQITEYCGDSGNVGIPQSTRHGASRKQQQDTCSQSLDEIELVTHAQGQGLKHILDETPEKLPARINDTCG